MLSKRELMRIAQKECVAMLGEDLVMAHKDLCCCTCGFSENGDFLYTLGMDTQKKEVPMGSEILMEYYAWVIVNPIDGVVKRDYKNSTLPT